jgi:hypothetical protein
MSDIVEPDDGPRRLDRRNVLKKAGIIGVGMWAAPIVTSITSPAFAQGSPRSTSCILLTEDHDVSAVITQYGACNTLEFGLQSPTSQVVCSPCSVGSSATLGSFAAGTELVFYLNDPADCCGCPQRYTCNDSKNARVIQDSPTSYRVQFRDNGCGCGSSDISEGVNLEATITLS